MDVFAYGTLMAPEVVKAVTGRQFDRKAAVLKDYARYRLQDASYPGLVPQPGAHTDGVLLLDVDEQSLLRLDRFEGREYRRVLVATEQGRALSYVLRDEHHHRISGGDWELDLFVAREMARFLGEK